MKIVIPVRMSCCLGEMCGPLTSVRDFASMGAFLFTEYAIQPLGLFPTSIELLLFHMKTLIECNEKGVLPERNSQ